MKSLFLHGYGLSVSVKNTRLSFKQGLSPFSEKQEWLELPSTKCTFDKVIIQGKGFVSTEALERLSESNINVMMLDKRGKLYSYFHQIGGHDPLIRQKQYDAFRDEKKLEFLRKWLIKQKIESQIQLFKEFVTEPKKFYSKYNEAWQISNNQKSSYNYSLKIRLETKNKIRPIINKMMDVLAGLDSVHSLQEIMQVEANIAKSYYPVFLLVST